MAKTTLVEPSTRLDTLQNELWRLFTAATSTRDNLGVTPSLRLSAARNVVENGIPEPDNSSQDCDELPCTCECEETDSCDLCTKPLDSVCSLEKTIDICNSICAFTGVGHLLTRTKQYEFIAIAENVYAEIGNKPFKLKSNKPVSLPDKEMKVVAGDFYQYLENFLEVNQIRIDELADAFDLDIISEVSDTLIGAIEKEAEIKMSVSLQKNEEVMERIFKRADYMRQYLEVIRDTTEYPIGVMWVDDNSIKTEKKIVNGVLKSEKTIQSDATRIDPKYFWATDDFTLAKAGKAVFTLKKFSNGDIQRLADMNVSGSAVIDTNIKDYLEDNPDGYRMHMAMLFTDDLLLTEGEYDVLITRGMYSRTGVEELKVKIPNEHNGENYIPCEVWYSGGKVLKVKVIECPDETLGVYTTVFRRRSSSIFGYSLHDFIYPFAKLYEGALKGIDKSVGKATGSIIMIDTGVIDDPDKYLQKDEKTGEVTLDLADDLIVEFDSTSAFASPNFKGVPIHVEQLPSDLNELLPIISLVYSQLEQITGIPSILVNTSNIPSALRTDSNFNAAFKASSKTIKALLRESEYRVLRPSIKYFFTAKAVSGDMRDFLLEADPEILLSDTLIREANDDRKLVTDLVELRSFGDLIPAEKFSALINNLGREVYNLDEDLIPGVEPLSTVETAQTIQPV